MHATDNQTRHACGGTILIGGSGNEAHYYCDRCHAFIYVSEDSDVPNGQDETANRKAWDDGKDSSPSA